MLLFDIDGVVADIQEFFIKDICEYVGCQPSDISVGTHNIAVSGYDVPNEVIYEVATQSTVKHVDEILPHEGAIEFLHAYYEMCTFGIPIAFLTARNGNNIVESTRYWLNKFIPVPYIVHFNADKKGFLNRNRNTYSGIVEDRLSTVNELHFLNHVYLVNRPWNIGREAKPHVRRIDVLSDLWQYISY